MSVWPIFGMLSAATRPLFLFAQNTYDPGAHAALQPAGPEAHRIEVLYWVIFWICFVVYAFMIAAYGRASWKSSRVTDPTVVIEDPVGDQRSAWFVGIAVGVTTSILFGVLIASVAVGRAVQTPRPQRVTIELTGQQWWWQAVYQDPEPDRTITTANEMHVPVGEQITVLAKSVDVIHSFWAPNVTGKRDLIPGYESAFSFQIDKPGVYHGQCAEFCGLQHAHMGFAIIAEPRADFERWQSQELKDAPDPTDDTSKRGRDVFLTHACVMCHTIRGTTAASNMGPDLTHIASRNRIAAETLPNTAGALAGWILDPQRIKPGNHMAANALAGDDLQALITYLQTLK